MADSLDNLAMDTESSTQTKPTRETGVNSKWDKIYSFLVDDVGHWIEGHHSENLSEFVPLTL
ncbi:hypothetical protein PC116_g2944 [Phytophthora cactorum]|uniref:Uncharacterized protein n=2 Tax=Phytophthora cactorum TaxID=29920 RepID=A0A329RS66_9STRA|nr:hypothetical protein Pcac1_g16752 [Phytophthora cactorum]KAG2793595.1 hypothetical protein PC111_g22973 [Phytophthora cactorum]KAG2811476.1 hypothetical protein PC112_g15589 [Phytophthora cactorum]KAG2890768.1 hypothetical protein PC114_g17296 [Phytophthora cactorum]KAG2903964.1 hypothetical protein PC115_g15145 [Phytophthora cactorum]